MKNQTKTITVRT